MRPADRMGLVVLVGLALAGPALVRRAVRRVDPWLAAVVAWDDGSSMTRQRDRRIDCLDPWGRSYRWVQINLMTKNGRTKAYIAVSDGPDPGQDHDDVYLFASPDNWPAWQRLVAEYPAALSGAVAVHLALLWRALRGRRRRAWLEAVLATLVTCPVAALVWLLVAGGLMDVRGAPPSLAVSRAVAVAISAWAVAALALLALRLTGSGSSPAAA